MDEISDLLGSSFAVSATPNSTVSHHPRYSCYKMSSKKGVAAQEVRRLAILKYQKQRRDDFLAVGRALVTGGTEDKGSDSEDEEIDWMACEDPIEAKNPESLPKGQSSRTTNVHRLVKSLKLRTSYRKQLMQSEWLIEIPADFEANWVALPVPVGRRSLIVAGDGKTKHFSRSGAFINSFPSCLPGGCRKNFRPVTILDCIFSEAQRTYFVLDVMIWSNKAYYDHTTEVRWFFAQQLLEQAPLVKGISRLNPFIFLPLSNFSCSKENLSRVFSEPSSFVYDPIELDGVLFYHKEAHYLPGTTPLVGWLKGFMLPEILGVSVSEKFMKQRPPDYGTMQKFVQEFNTREQSRRKSPLAISQEKDEEIIVD